MFCEADKIIYFQLFQKHSTHSLNEATNIKIFSMFLLYVYALWWFMCTFSTLGLYLDLQLVKLSYNFKKTDVVVAENILNKLKLYLWYLTQKMIP